MIQPKPAVRRSKLPAHEVEVVPFVAHVDAAAALVATVTGLLVAIPAMFAYNFMVTTIRAITQELDGYATRYATQIEHVYVDNRPLSEEIKSANEALAGRIIDGLKA